MRFGFFLLLSLACAFALLALVLWQAAAARSRRAASLRRLVARAQLPEPTWQEERVPGPGRLALLPQRLDLAPGVRSSLLVLGPAPVAASVVAAAGGWPLGLLAFVLCVLATCAAVTLRREAAQRRLTRALPGFVDALVRMIALGQSPGAAFVAAAPNTEGPLRRALSHAESLVAAGVELDAALTQAGRMFASEALLLLGSVMRMALRYGGGVDQVLERLAGFLRDREEAEEELAATSAETRLSSWVLGTLPVAVTLLIMLTNTQYLSGMWADATGRKLLAGGLALEIAGAFLLYRLARLR